MADRDRGVAEGLRRWVLLPAFLLSLAPALAADSSDGVSLTVTKGPSAGEFTLDWVGGLPDFELFRSVDAATIEDPGNSLGETSGFQWIDTPPAGDLFFYRATNLTCTVGSDCSSGNCADAVCCSTPCLGTCEACNLFGLGGSCEFIAAGSDPDDECPGDSLCDGGGVCVGQCSNGMQDGDETGVDCGGAICPPCADGPGSGYALFSDGVANALEYASTTISALPQSAPAYWGFWFRPGELGRIHTIASRWRESVTHRVWRVYFNASDELVLETSSNGLNINQTTWAAGTVDLRLNQWDFWMVTTDNNGLPRLYRGRDGAGLVDLGAGSTTGPNGHHRFTFGSGLAHLHVGNLRDPASGPNNFRGHLDELQVAGGSISAGDRTLIYTRIRTPTDAGPGTGSGWGFEADLFDGVGFRHLTSVNALFRNDHHIQSGPQEANGTTGKSLFSDGVANAIECVEKDVSSRGDPVTGHNFEVAFWFRPNELGRIHTILSKWMTSANQRTFRIYFDASDELVIETSQNGSIIDVSTWATPGLQLDTWQFWVVSLDVGGGGASRAYRRNVGEAEVDLGEGGGTHSTFANLIQPNLVIGNLGGSSQAGSQNFRGHIDNLRMKREGPIWDSTDRDNLYNGFARRHDADLDENVGGYETGSAWRFNNDFLDLCSDNQDMVSVNAILDGTMHVGDGGVPIDLP